MNRFLKLLLILVFAGCCGGNSQAQIYVAYYNAGAINKFDADTGALTSENFIIGLNQPRGLCLAGDTLYVLQYGDGSIGKYDAKTGATINDRFITGLNMPQAFAMADGAIYVTSFGWTREGQVPVLIGKYNAVTGAAINDALVKTTTQPTALAVSGNKLFVTGAGLPGITVYDATTGAKINDHFARPIYGAWALLASGSSLWITSGAGEGGPEGAVFQFDAETGTPALAVGYFPRPLIRHLQFPHALGISGNYVYVGGKGTSVSKYSVTTGELIKDAFIPSYSDRLGGLAVVPTEATPDVSWKETEFEARNLFLNLAFWTSIHGNLLLLGAGILVVVVILGLGVLVMRHRVPNTTDPTTAEPLPEPPPAQAEAEISFPPAAEEEPVIAEEPQTNPRSTSTLAVIAFVLMGLTLAVAGVLAWLGFQAIPSPEEVGRLNTSDLIGIWGYENNTREPSQMPILLSLEISATHLEFSKGSGPIRKDGQWHDNGFWFPNDDGSGEVEVAKIISPEEIEFHRSAVEPGNPTVDRLYKERGDDAEMKAIADKYPGPITYPPPAGVIKYWMTEYELSTLPWKPDHIEITGEAYSRGIVYVYRSDDPHLEKLEVTVKNHRVVEIKGGNG